MAVGPTHWYFRICGVAPPRGRSRYLYCIVPTAMTCFVIVSIMFQVNNHYYLATLPLSLGELYMLATVYNPEKFQSILDDLESVDDQLEKMGVLIEDQFPSKTMAVTLFAQFSLLMTMLGSKESLADNVISLIFIMLFNAAWNQFTVFAQLIHSRFSALNSQLTRIAASADKTLLQIVETRLDSVFRVHSSLHAIVAEINSYYCIYNLLVMAVRFYYLAFFSYFNLTSLDNEESKMSLSMVLRFVGTMILVVCHSVACHICAAEANRTPRIAHRILNVDSPCSLWDRIGQFSRLNSDNKVELSVGGIFSFDLKLLAKMAAMVFSYVTIALQLRDVDLVGPEPSSDLPSANSTVN